MMTDDDLRRLTATTLIPPVSVPEAAVTMSVSIRTVQRMIASGDLRVVRYGRRLVRIPHEEIRRMLEGRLLKSYERLGIGGLRAAPGR